MLFFSKFKDPDDKHVSRNANLQNRYKCRSFCHKNFVSLNEKFCDQELLELGTLYLLTLLLQLDITMYACPFFHILVPTDPTPAKIPIGDPTRPDPTRTAQPCLLLNLKFKICTKIARIQLIHVTLSISLLKFQKCPSQFSSHILKTNNSIPKSFVYIFLLFSLKGVRGRIVGTPKKHRILLSEENFSAKKFSKTHLSSKF